MKKLVSAAFAVLILASASAREKDSKWDISGYAGASYNSIVSVPDNMSHSGLGLDFCLIRAEYGLSRKTSATLGILDLQIDYRYLDKGHMFQDIPFRIVTAPEDAKAKSHMRDFAFSFPVGISYHINSRCAAELAVAPGVGCVSYFNDYIQDDIRHKDRFRPNSDRWGFRLDAKAMVWYEDLGLYLRFQPVGVPSDSCRPRVTFSAGLAARF